MFSPNLRLQRPLEDFIDIWEKLTPRTLPLLQDLLSFDVVFEDPYFRVQGWSDVEKLLLHRSDFLESYRVVDFSLGRREQYASFIWVNGDLEGTTVLVFSLENEISFISEYWGEHRDVAFKKYQRFKL